MLGFFSFTHFVFYPLLAATLILGGLTEISIIAAGLFLLRLITILIMYSRLATSFGERSLFPFSPVFDLLRPFINFVFVVASLFYTNQRWK